MRKIQGHFEVRIFKLSNLIFSWPLGAKFNCDQGHTGEENFPLYPFLNSKI